jgi:hypothetical protein
MSIRTASMILNTQLVDFPVHSSINAMPEFATGGRHGKTQSFRPRRAIGEQRAPRIRAGVRGRRDATTLLNPDKEPQNWLMNHRTYDGQRFSPLTRINRNNVKNLKLAYAVPLGGGAGNEYSVATPLAEDGFLYVTDSWGVLYKIDGTSGDVGRIVWRMDPKQDRQQRNRGAALWGNLVIRVPASHLGLSPPTKRPARWCGRPPSRTRRT